MRMQASPRARLRLPSHKCLRQRLSLPYSKLPLSWSNFLRPFLYFKEKPVGTIRYRQTGDRTFKLERFAILKEERNKGYGKAAFTFLVNKLEEDYNPCTIYFNAQYHLLDYYRSLGFKEEGETFYEANIKHIKMVRVI